MRAIEFLAIAAIVSSWFALSASTRPASAAEKDDYLSPALRTQVERLKLDVANFPTNRDTIRPRTLVLWQWANAYARQGGILPVELPITVAMVTAFPDQRELRRALGNVLSVPWAGGGPARALDRFVRELQVREEQPDAIGPIESDGRGPFPAESFQTIRQTYTVGSMPMVEGGGLLVAKHFIADHGRFQTTNPKAKDYVTVRCSNSQAKFTAESMPLSGMHGGLFAPVDTLVFRLSGSDLQPGDTITVTYGDRSEGSPGFRVQSYSNDAFPLPLYVDLEGNGNYFTLPLVPYKVVGKGVAGVHGFAPSIVGVGEALEVSIRSEDEYYNRATGPIPAYSVHANDRLLREIPAGQQAITVLEDIRFDKPGVYRFRIESADGSIRGVANPVWVRENPARRIYWGETHGHCGFAEGQGTPEAFFEFGRDDARLDFLTHSEHDIWMDDSEWETLKRNVDKYTEQGKFIALLGYEWTARAEQGGHHNVFFRTAPGRKRVPLQEAPSLSQLYHRLGHENDMRDVLIIPHAHEPGDYRHSHPHMEHLVEIMSMHGRHEWFGIMYLRHGHQVGFVAASDDHLSHPGYVTPTVRGLADSGGLAAVMAPEKTTNALFDALKNLDAYATTGDRIILDLELNGTTMGQRAEYATKRQMRGRVIGTAPIASIDIVKNGHDVEHHDYLASDSSKFVRVTFASPSDPIVRDSPRGWRRWIGKLNIGGARLVGFSADSFYNPRSEWARRSAGDANGVEFSAWTRGSEKSIVLELDDVTDEAGVTIELVEATERYSTPSRFRSPAKLPAQRIELQLPSGKSIARHKLRVDRFEDTVSLRRVRPDPPMEQTVEFVDEHDPNRGDYYYVRVKQTNGAMAWSSPIWVGGYPPR